MNCAYLKSHSALKAVTNTDANYFPILNENYPKNRNGFYDVRQQAKRKCEGKKNQKR